MVVLALFTSSPCTLSLLLIVHCLCNPFVPQKCSVGFLLYLADNLACLPYSTLEEPLFVVHHIDLTVSVTGSNLLQQFREVWCGVGVVCVCVCVCGCVCGCVWVCVWGGGY